MISSSTVMHFNSELGRLVSESTSCIKKKQYIQASKPAKDDVTTLLHSYFGQLLKFGDFDASVQTY